MRNSLVASRRLIAVFGAAALAAACGDATEPEPVAPASVELTSPLGLLLDVGGSAQLVATAKDDAGATMSGQTFTWSSSNPTVVSVDGAGFIQALDVGTATIRVDAGGAGASLSLRVVDADLAGIAALARDPFVAALVGEASGALGTRLHSAVAGCATGVGQGRLEAVQDCITAIKTEATNASDPTNRAVLAVLVLFLDQVERLLNL